MVRTEISLFLKNAPGELGKLAKTLAQAGINIAARAISHMGGTAGRDLHIQVPLNRLGEQV